MAGVAGVRLGRIEGHLGVIDKRLAAVDVKFEKVEDGIAKVIELLAA